MSPKIFLRRILLLVVIAAALSLTGAMSAGIISAVGMAVLGAFFYTGLDERILRGKLFGKVGGSNVMVWWLTHLTLETVVFAALTYAASAICGWHIVTPWLADTGIFLAWLLVAGETAKTLGLLLAVGMASKK